MIILKWASYFVVGIIISVLLYVSMWISNIGMNHPTTAWISHFYQYKEQAVKNVNGQKLLVVSGSTSLFAFDSDKLKARFHIPVVNYGVAAGLGLRYILDKAKSSLKSGDSVLLPLEYALYQDKVVPDQTLALYMLDDQGYFSSLPLTEQLSIIFQTPFSLLLSQPNINANTLQQTLYSTINLTPYGDFKGETLASMYVDFNIENYSYPSPSPLEINTRSKQLLSDFVIWSRLNNINVIAMPPAVISSPELGNEVAMTRKQSIVRFWRSLSVSFDIPFEELEFEKMYMFENPYHLNPRGREVFMKILDKYLNVDN